MIIRHLTHNEIDFNKWDQIIDSAKNHFCYAYSWYLDAVSPGWEALVSSDYQYIMPLTIKKKLGVRYIVQPILSQQLGIFSTEEITKNTVETFIKKIPYKSFAIQFNFSNIVEKSVEKPNFILNLSREYNHLLLSFSKNTKRNIIKSKKEKIRIIEKMDKHSFLNFHDSVDHFFVSAYKNTIQILFEAAEQHNMLNIFGVLNNGNECIAAVSMIESPQKMTYLMAASNQEGKDTSAMFLLLDYIIGKYAGTNYILDFEGSSIEGIARFYKSFGAVNQPFYFIEQFRPAVLLGKI